MPYEEALAIAEAQAAFEARQTAQVGLYAGLAYWSAPSPRPGSLALLELVARAARSGLEGAALSPAPAAGHHSPADAHAAGPHPRPLSPGARGGGGASAETLALLTGKPVPFIRERLAAGWQPPVVVER